MFNSYGIISKQCLQNIYEHSAIIAKYELCDDGKLRPKILIWHIPNGGDHPSHGVILPNEIIDQCFSDEKGQRFMINLIVNIFTPGNSYRKMVIDSLDDKQPTLVVVMSEDWYHANNKNESSSLVSQQTKNPKECVVIQMHSAQGTIVGINPFSKSKSGNIEFILGRPDFESSAVASHISLTPDGTHETNEVLSRIMKASRCQ